MTTDNPQRMGSHSSRWLVAVVLLPPVVYSMIADNYLLFFGLILIVGGLTWWEFAVNLFGAERWGLLCLGLAGWAAVASGAYFYGPAGQSIGLVLALGSGAAYALWALERESGPVLVNLLGRYALGHLYISFLASFFLLLKKTGSGGPWLIYLLLVTIAADTGAFYVGRKVKGPKLWPKVSPNKTLSGLLGGALAALAASMLSIFFLPANNIFTLAFLGLFLGLWGAAGDLFESALKRAIDIKDSSTILMGHGGFLDRLDSLLFNVVPVFVVADLIVNAQ